MPGAVSDMLFRQPSGTIMKIICSDDHRSHFPQGEVYGGELVTPFERPSRIEYILRELKARKMTDISAPDAFDMAAAAKVHAPDYLQFLESAWSDWTKAGYRGEIIATVFPVPGMRKLPPKYIDGRVGYYAHSVETAITAGTWDAARSSAAVALSAQKIVASGARSAFALCRPPGHHAHRNLYGGYCFLNNAAIAAQAFRDSGAKKVAILDVDFHHGNGTQDIFYERSDVLFLSLHGEPEQAYPHFLGYADEKGAGAGEGFNVNYPLPRGTPYGPWSEALADACARIVKFGAEVVVVSLGVDTYKDDPISFFGLDSSDFTSYGARIAGLKLPTLFVMEGGYAIEAIGVNTVNVLTGFMEAA
jgi:acetoin utilization deacetylase AcuC-like enzyme